MAVRVAVALLALLLAQGAWASSEEQAVLEAIHAYDQALQAARDRTELYPYLSAETVLRCQQGNPYVGDLEMLKMFGLALGKPDARVTSLMIRGEEARVDVQFPWEKVLMLTHYSLKRESGLWKIVLPP